MYRYKYESTVISHMEHDNEFNEDERIVSAQGHTPGLDEPIRYPNGTKDGAVCYVWSNDPIDGLTLVDENVEVSL